MEAFCKFCLKFQYEAKETQFQCKADGIFRKAKKRCNLEGEFEPNPTKDRDFKKEIEDARTGSSGVHESVQAAKPAVRKEKSGDGSKKVSGKARVTSGSSSKKASKKKK